MNPPIKHIPEQNSAITYKRKQFLILPKLQLSLIFASVLVFLFSSMIYFAALNFVFMKLHQIGTNMDINTNSVYFTEIKELENLSTKIYGFTVLFGLIATYFGGLRLSHKIAGPIYYLNKQIRSICSNESTDGVHFRKGDFLIELQESFNLLMKKYRELKKN